MDHQVSCTGRDLFAVSAYLGAGHNPLEVLRDEELHDALGVGDTDFIESLV